MRRFPILFSLLALLVLLPGCYHGLTTAEDFKRRQLVTTKSPLRIGLISNSTTQAEAELEKEIVEALTRAGVFREVVHPYDPSASEVDMVVRLEVDLETKGYSGNFFISWPGYYIFLPPLHGFKYRHNLDFSAQIESPNGGLGYMVESVDQVRIRHASINRTWIQAGWLWLWPYWDVAAIIGGAGATRYDTAITDEAIREYGRYYGEHVARQIINSINMHQFQKAP